MSLASLFILVLTHPPSSYHPSLSQLSYFIPSDSIFLGHLSQHPHPLFLIPLTMYAMCVSVCILSSFYLNSYFFPYVTMSMLPSITIIPCSLRFPTAFPLLPCHRDVYGIVTFFINSIEFMI